MSNIWTFSPSSEQLLKRCLEVSAPIDLNNKWVKRFKKKEDVLNKNDTSENEESKTEIIEVCEIDPEITRPKTPEHIGSESNEEFFESIELEPVGKFNYIIQECLGNPETITKLAENLSTSSIEKISNHLFCKNDIDKTFLDKFYTNFIPAFLKRESCRFFLDMLVNANKSHPVEFKKTLNVILKDTGIPNNLLTEFTQSFSEKEKFEFIKHVSEIDLTPQEFHHNLFTIYATYKDCKTNTYIQTCMEKTLIDNAEFCCNEKNFGKLLLAFLQEQRNFGHFKQSNLVEKSIEVNKTPFKKPCMNLFKDIVDKYT